MANNKHFTHHSPVIIDENSALPFAMSASLGEAGNRYVKSQHSSNYQLSKNLSLVLGDDETVTFVKQHWYFERPIYKRVYTGSERGRQWNDKRTGTERIDDPDAFDDVLWEYAQGEADAAKKDEFTYAEWFINVRGGVSTDAVDFGQAPPSNISAETAEKYKTRLLETLKGNANQALLKQYVNHIMNETRNSARGVGVERARTNPVVEDAMRSAGYRLWRSKTHRPWFSF